MALDTQYRGLAGIQPTRVEPGDLSAGLARLDDAEVRAAQGMQNTMKMVEGGLTLKKQFEAERINQNLKNQMPRDATPLDYDLVNRYNTEVGGELPMTVDEKGMPRVDMSSIRDLYGLKSLAAIEAQGGNLDDATKLMLKQMTDDGYIHEAVNPDGTLRSAAELRDIMAKRPPVRGKDALDFEQTRIELESRYSQLQDLKRLLAAEGEELVGPWAGSVPKRFWDGMWAFMGNKAATERREGRRQTEMFSRADVLDLASKMKGALSDKDLALLIESVPTLSDTTATWGEFLDRLDTNMKKAAENMRDGVTFDADEELWSNLRTSAARTQTPVMPKFDPKKADLTLADKVPMVVNGYRNSFLLQGRIGTNEATGKRGVSFWADGQQYGRHIALPDDVLQWIASSQRALASGQAVSPYVKKQRTRGSR